MRWIWIDNFLEFRPGKSARAMKQLSLAEDYFAEHFPGYPIMPATLILEGLAQTGGILVGDVNNFQEKVVLAKIISARFFGEAIAGQRLIYDVELEQIRPEGATINGKVFLEMASPKSGSESSSSDGGKLLAEANIFFAHLDQSRSQQLFGDHNFVFSGEMKNLLGLAKVLAERPQDGGELD